MVSSKASPAWACGDPAKAPLNKSNEFMIKFLSKDCTHWGSPCTTSWLKRSWRPRNDGFWMITLATKACWWFSSSLSETGPRSTCRIDALSGRSDVLGPYTNEIESASGSASPLSSSPSGSNTSAYCAKPYYDLRKNTINCIEILKTQSLLNFVKKRAASTTICRFGHRKK